MPRPVRWIAGLITLATLPACDKPAPPPATTRPTSAPAIAPAARPTTTPAVDVPKADAPPKDVLSLVRAIDPKYPTRVPLDTPADLADAAKIVLTSPAYVDPLGNLWLTHPAAPPLATVLAGPIADTTAVTRDRVVYVYWPPDGSAPHAVVERDSGRRAVVSAKGETPIDLPNADFARAQLIDAGVAVPVPGGVAVLSADLKVRHRIDVKTTGTERMPTLAAAWPGVWAWVPWDEPQTGSASPVYVDAAGGHVPDADAGWPARLIEAVPLADGSVLTVTHGEDDTPMLKLIQAGEPRRPPAELLKTITPLAEKLADPDPRVREDAQRSLEQQGPAALPVLETLREQLPPEAQVRIETLLGQRFAPTLGGLRPLPGKVRTIARFPGGGCALLLEGGGETDATADEQAGTVIPATVLIRPGLFVERVDLQSWTDFVPGRQSLQWVGGELLVADAKDGPRRIVGSNAKPVLPTGFADFDTVRAIDARHRWLLTSAKRPGSTLLIDPTLPDTTPRLPVWTIAAQGGVGRTAEGWPAVKRKDRLFVLERDGWKVDEKPDRLIESGLTLPACFDAAGRSFEVHDDAIVATDAAGRETRVKIASADGVAVAVWRDRLLAYTPDGTVRRFRIEDGPTLTAEASFTQGVPKGARDVYLDPAGRLIFAGDDTLSIGFPDGRVPGRLSELMLSVDR